MIGLSNFKPGSKNLPINSIVQFQVDDFIAPDHIILAGMYGIVMEIPYAPCTPGISTMIKIYGRNESFGHYNHHFTLVEKELDENDIKDSISLCENAFEILEQKYGYTGFIKMGKDIRPQEKYLNEIFLLFPKFFEWKNEDKFLPQINGNLKRLKKILLAFKIIHFSLKLNHLP